MILSTLKDRHGAGLQLNFGALDEVIRRLPVRVLVIQTDNGAEFHLRPATLQYPMSPKAHCKFGAGCPIRTGDLRFTKPLHYHCAKPA